jgi:spore germination cell wall hydrolase CwlJ-like protein
MFTSKLNRLSKIALSVLFIIFGFTISNTNIHMFELPKVESKQLAQVDPKQIACMAKNIFFEAGHETIKGQAAVAHVVMNRVRHGFGKNPCQVIYQKTQINDKLICQFSWVCEGKPEPNKNSYRYKVAEQVAYDVMVNNRYQDVLPRTALFFHNTTVDPLWPYKQVAKIGGHVFYSKAKKITQSKNND